MTQTTTYTLIENTTTENTFKNKGELLDYLTLQQAEPVPEVTPTPTPAEDLSTILGMLQDPRFTLRTLLSICTKTGLSADMIYQLLGDNEIPYVVKYKRGSHEELIGLSERN